MAQVPNEPAPRTPRSIAGNRVLRRAELEPLLHKTAIKLAIGATEAVAQENQRKTAARDLRSSCRRHLLRFAPPCGLWGIRPPGLAIPRAGEA